VLFEVREYNRELQAATSKKYQDSDNLKQTARAEATKIRHRQMIVLPGSTCKIVSAVVAIQATFRSFLVRKYIAPTLGRKILVARANKCLVRWWKQRLFRHRMRMLVGLRKYGESITQRVLYVRSDVFQTVVHAPNAFVSRKLWPEHRVLVDVNTMDSFPTVEQVKTWEKKAKTGYNPFKTNNTHTEGKQPEVQHVVEEGKLSVYAGRKDIYTRLHPFPMWMIDSWEDEAVPVTADETPEFCCKKSSLSMRCRLHRLLTVGVQGKAVRDLNSMLGLEDTQDRPKKHSTRVLRSWYSPDQSEVRQYDPIISPYGHQHGVDSSNIRNFVRLSFATVQEARARACSIAAQTWDPIHPWQTCLLLTDQHAQLCFDSGYSTSSEERAFLVSHYWQQQTFQSTSTGHRTHDSRSQIPTDNLFNQHVYNRLFAAGSIAVPSLDSTGPAEQEPLRPGEIRLPKSLNLDQAIQQQQQLQPQHPRSARVTSSTAGKRQKRLLKKHSRPSSSKAGGSSDVPVSRGRAFALKEAALRTPEVDVTGERAQIKPVDGFLRSLELQTMKQQIAESTRLTARRSIAEQHLKEKEQYLAAKQKTRDANIAHHIKMEIWQQKNQAEHDRRRAEAHRVQQRAVLVKDDKKLQNHLRFQQNAEEKRQAALYQQAEKVANHRKLRASIQREEREYRHALQTREEELQRKTQLASTKFRTRKAKQARKAVEKASVMAFIGQRNMIQRQLSVGLRQKKKQEQSHRVRESVTQKKETSIRNRNRVRKHLYDKHTQRRQRYAAEQLTMKQLAAQRKSQYQNYFELRKAHRDHTSSIRNMAATAREAFNDKYKATHSARGLSNSNSNSSSNSRGDSRQRPSTTERKSKWEEQSHLTWLPRLEDDKLSSQVQNLKHIQSKMQAGFQELKL
jgi:hypothetical protein